jgi:hypothetical protein
MCRRLSSSAPIPLIALLFALPLAPVGAASTSRDSTPSILQRFLALGDPTPSQFRALRHLEARSDRFEKSASMDVWTEGDATGFRYQIVAEEGSDYIRSHVFRASLETEKKVWASGEPDKSGITPDNYTFEEGGTHADGLISLVVKPRRTGVLMVDGSIFLNPDDGELVRMEGRLSKSPSFWTRRIQIVRWYKRFVGFRMPVALESVANVRIAGMSTFRMSYEYESVNKQQIGHPQPRLLARARP